MRLEGKIMQGIGGLYEVRYREGDRHSRLFCRARGNLKRNEEKLLVGDLVTFERDGEEGVISSVLPRKNFLIRPPLSNLDDLFIVQAAKDPAPAYETLDKLSAIALHNGIRPVFIVTKADLSCEGSNDLAAVYRLAGFPVFTVSAEEEPLALSSFLAQTVRDGRSAAFAGASGVGKSTLLNRLFPSLSLSTGEVSRKIGRGRHTTRKVQLFEVGPAGCEGFLADTPGFSMLDFLRFDFFTLAELADAFPEFSRYFGECRYADCTHTGEEECGVRQAVRRGEIAESRHESYISLYRILKEKARRY